MDALVKVGKPAVEPLLELLEDAGNLVRLWSAVYAAKILGEIGDDRAVGPWSSCWTTGASTTTR